MNKKIAVSGMWFVQTVADQGPRGMLPFPAGEYESTKSYTATANVAPYVLLSGTYYVMNKVGTWLGTSTGKTPAQDYAVNGVNATWIPFENYKAIYVELLMAKMGLIGKAVFYDEYMFSQSGTDAAGNPSTNYQGFANGTFKPNLLLNFLTGDSELAGKIIAKENSQIAGMKVVGNSLRGVQAVFGKYNRTVTNVDTDQYTIINNIDKQLVYLFQIPDGIMDFRVLLPSAHDLLLKGIEEYSFELTIITHKSNKYTVLLKGNDDAAIILNGAPLSLFAMAKGEVMKLIYSSNSYYIISESKLLKSSVTG